MKVQCSELPGNFTTAGGVEKNTATQASIKICDEPSLQTSPNNNSSPTSSQSKIVINTDGTTKVRNIKILV
ncbi:Protein of unknown function [Gryllus bimaculatus]|nr:Protein of unknown function [Gryllus bimaculatus]